jgi:MarR family transcriptional regulator, multiple antibiotic resistance protein MarR
MPERNRELFLKASTTAHLVGQIVERQVAPVGIPAFLLALLTHIRDHEPVTPTGVSAASGAPLTTLRDNIQRLVDRGLVRRIPNPVDGRSYLLVITPKGRRLTAEAGEALLEAYVLLERELGELTRHERRLDELNAALATVLAALEGSAAAQPR